MFVCCNNTIKRLDLQSCTLIAIVSVHHITLNDYQAFYTVLYFVLEALPLLKHLCLYLITLQVLEQSLELSTFPTSDQQP